MAWADHIWSQFGPKRLGPARLVFDGIVIGFGLSMLLVGATRGAADWLGAVGVVLYGAADLLRMKDGVLSFAGTLLAIECMGLSSLTRESNRETNTVMLISFVVIAVVGPLAIWRMDRLRRSNPSRLPPNLPAG